MTAERIVRRIADSAPGLRTAPPDGGSAAPEAIPPRGDHELNPEIYEPGRPLIGAAVLVPIVVPPPASPGGAGGEPTVLLTRRTDHLHDHAGQISFPGGRIDPGDSGPEAAALREAEEEVGLARRSVRLVGRLDTYIIRTGFEVVPVVGLVTPPLDLTPDSFEVAEIFEVPLAFFLDAGNRQRHSRVFKGKERHFFAYPFGDYFIWGATAGMLSNLAEVLNDT